MPRADSNQKHNIHNINKISNFFCFSIWCKIMGNYNFSQDIQRPYSRAFFFVRIHISFGAVLGGKEREITVNHVSTSQFLFDYILHNYIKSRLVVFKLKQNY